MIIYISALASMVEKLKGEKQELEKEVLKGDLKESKNLEKLETILIGMQDNKDLKSLKN